ncbi:MAG: hypothetical protein IKS96_02750 [Fibrobacter sp.]|nr:hypothetical protein [Fibrobacter sp.]
MKHSSFNNVVEIGSTVNVPSLKVVYGKRSMQIFFDGHTNIKQGTWFVSAFPTADRLETLISNRVEVGTKEKAVSATFGFPPRISIKDGSKIHPCESLTIPVPKSLHHCARRLRPIGAA